MRVKNTNKVYIQQLKDTTKVNTIFPFMRNIHRAFYRLNTNLKPTRVLLRGKELVTSGSLVLCSA